MTAASNAKWAKRIGDKAGKVQAVCIRPPLAQKSRTVGPPEKHEEI
jgi:hypothetical protein